MGEGGGGWQCRCGRGLGERVFCWDWIVGRQERRGEDAPALLFYLKRVSCKRRVLACALPGFMTDRVARVDCEGVGLVGVVHGIRVVGADAELVVGRQVVDVD